MPARGGRIVVAHQLLSFEFPETENMSRVFFANFLQTHVPSLLSKRFRGKINIQRPRPPHYDRARVLAVTQPIYKEKPANLKCLKDLEVRAAKPENPYERIIAQEVFNWFEHSKFIGIFHLNSISQEELFKVRVELHNKNIALKSYGRNIMQQALANTTYENTLPLFDTTFCIMFAPDTKNLKDVLRISKKIPQLILLAGVLENRIMSRTEIAQYAALPSLQVAQARLCNVLNSAASSLVHNVLDGHQKQLVQILDVHKDNLSKDGESSS